MEHRILELSPGSLLGEEGEGKGGQGAGEREGAPPTSGRSDSFPTSDLLPNLSELTSVNQEDAGDENLSGRQPPGLGTWSDLTPQPPHCPSRGKGLNAMKLRLLCCSDLSLCNSSAANCSEDGDGTSSTVDSDQGSEDELLLPTFSTASKVRVVITLAIFLISSYLNLTVLCGALRRKGSGRSHIRTLIVNLSCADLLVTFMVMPLDAAWNITVQWYAGDPACKLLMFLKLLSMYSCAFVTVVISLDRYCAILHPLGISRANERNRTMLTGAWIMSVILATPQLFLFHTASISVPAPFTQCVTHGSFKEPWQEKVYFFFTFLWLFLLPLIIMVFCYTSILITITQKMKVNGDIFSKDADSRCTRNCIPKVRMKTLKMTIVLVSTFIICWTPYYVLGFWYNFFPAMINKKELPESINHALFTFGMLNSFVDPVISRIGYLRLSNG